MARPLNMTSGTPIIIHETEKSAAVTDSRQIKGMIYTVTGKKDG